MRCYKNKKVLITGNTGFKGNWLTLALHNMGAQVVGYADIPPKSKAILGKKWIEKNIKQYYNKVENHSYLKKVILNEKPDIVFHLAAQPLVLKSYEFPKETFLTNALGTLNLLELMRTYNKNIPIIIITTDKVYSNKRIKKYKEADRLSGNCPYSTSKVCAEEISKAYSNLGMKIITARAGNIIGGGDWADNRIIPDIVKAINNNKKPVIRNPDFTRPWLYVLDAINGYLLIGKKLLKIKKKKYYDTYNLAPINSNSKNVLFLVEQFCNKFKNISFIIEKNNNKYKENKILNLCSKKIQIKLNWKTKVTFEEAIDKTSLFYKIKSKEKLLQNSIKEINSYFNYKGTNSKNIRV